MSPRHIRTTAVFHNVVSPGPFVFPYRYNTTPIVIELSPSGNQTLQKKKKKNSISLNGKHSFINIIIGFENSKNIIVFGRKLQLLFELYYTAYAL